MLHVDPVATVAAAPPAFDAFRYLRELRAAGYFVHARCIEGRRYLDWDLPENPRPVPEHVGGRLSRKERIAVFEILMAERWIAGARESGLLVFPYLAMGKVVGQTGQELEGPNDYSAASARFMKHPAFRAVETCRKGVVFETLCAEFGIDPDDPELCEKVNEKMKAEEKARPMNIRGKRAPVKYRGRKPDREPCAEVHS